MKLGLIGCGARGRALAAGAADLGLEVALCADPKPSAARQAAAACGARTIRNSNAILENKSIGAILICAPPRDAAPLCLRAAKARKHVFLAPPLAADAGSARKAFDAARAAGTHVYIAHDSRIAPEYAAIAAQLDARAIGKPGFIRIVRVGATHAPGAVSGALDWLLPSDLDWLVARFGRRPRIFAQTARAPGVDHAALTLTFPRGPIVQWAGTCRARGETSRSSVEICGDNGMIQFTTDDLVVEYTPIRGKSALVPDRVNPTAPSLAVRHLERFAALIGTAPQAETYAHDLAVLRLAAAAAESARGGRELAV